MSSRASGRLSCRLSCRALSWVSFSSVPRVGTSNPLRSWSALRCRLARRVACLVGCLVGLCRGSSFPLVGTSNPLRSWSALRCHLMSSRASGRLSCRIVSAPGNPVGGLIASRPFLSHVDPHVGCLLRSRIRDAWSDARQGAHRSIDPATQCVQGSVGPPTHCACGRIYPPTQCACRSIEPLTQYAHRFIDPPTQGAHWSIDPPTQCAERSMDPRTQCADRSIDPPTPTRLDPATQRPWIHRLYVYFCFSPVLSAVFSSVDASRTSALLRAVFSASLPLASCRLAYRLRLWCRTSCRSRRSGVVSPPLSSDVVSRVGSPVLSAVSSGRVVGSSFPPYLWSEPQTRSAPGRPSAIIWCRLACRVACLFGCLAGCLVCCLVGPCLTCQLSCQHSRVGPPVGYLVGSVFDVGHPCPYSSASSLFGDRRSAPRRPARIVAGRPSSDTSREPVRNLSATLRKSLGNLSETLRRRNVCTAMLSSRLSCPPLTDGTLRGPLLQTLLV